MILRTWILVLTVAVIGTGMGCASPPKAPRAVTMDTWGLRPGDIEQCAQRMARDLIADPLIQRSNPPVRVGIVSVKNETKEPFVGGSRDMVLTRIQTILFRALRSHQPASGGTAKFIVMRESVRQAIDAQRRQKRDGEVTHRGLKDMHGVDYFLSGVYQALDKVADGRRIVEMYMTFELSDAETGEMVWTHDYLVKTVTRE